MKCKVKKQFFIVVSNFVNKLVFSAELGTSFSEELSTIIERLFGSVFTFVKINNPPVNMKIRIVDHTNDMNRNLFSLKLEILHEMDCLNDNVKSNYFITYFNNLHYTAIFSEVL